MKKHPYRLSLTILIISFMSLSLGSIGCKGGSNTSSPPPQDASPSTGVDVSSAPLEDKKIIVGILAGLNPNLTSSSAPLTQNLTPKKNSFSLFSSAYAEEAFCTTAATSEGYLACPVSGCVVMPPAPPADPTLGAVCVNRDNLSTVDLGSTSTLDAIVLSRGETCEASSTDPSIVRAMQFKNHPIRITSSKCRGNSGISSCPRPMDREPRRSMATCQVNELT